MNRAQSRRLAHAPVTARARVALARAVEQHAPFLAGSPDAVPVLVAPGMVPHVARIVADSHGTARLVPVRDRHGSDQGGWNVLILPLQFAKIIARGAGAELAAQLDQAARRGRVALVLLGGLGGVVWPVSLPSMTANPAASR